MITFIERDARLKNLKDESSRKTSISRKVILKTSTFLRRVARSKSRAFNSTTSRCIKDCSIWWTRFSINVRRDEKFRYLILNWYFLWMIWAIRLNVSFSRCCDLSCFVMMSFEKVISKWVDIYMKEICSASKVSLAIVVSLW